MSNMVSARDPPFVINLLERPASCQPIKHMCGIFAYIHYLVERDRDFLIKTLLTGLARLEYRGYDSSGIAMDGDAVDEVCL